MNIPTTYFEWISCLDYIKDKPRNDSYVDNLNKGRLDAGDDLKVKISKEIASVVSYRLEGTINAFNDYIATSQIDYNSLSLELLSLKHEFNYAKKLVSIRIIPEVIRNDLLKGIQKKADELQEVLVKQTVYTDRSGILNSLIKNNPINKLEEVK